MTSAKKRKCGAVYAFMSVKLVIDANVGWKALVPEEGCDLVTADDKLIKTLSGFPIVSLASL